MLENLTKDCVLQIMDFLVCLDKKQGERLVKEKYQLSDADIATLVGMCGVSLCAFCDKYCTLPMLQQCGDCGSLWIDLPADLQGVKYSREQPHAIN